MLPARRETSRWEVGDTEQRVSHLPRRVSASELAAVVKLFRELRRKCQATRELCASGDLPKTSQHAAMGTEGVIPAFGVSVHCRPGHPHAPKHMLPSGAHAHMLTNILLMDAHAPEMTDTAPNSPMARALHRITPYSRPQRMLGSVTFQNTCGAPGTCARATGGFCCRQV